MSANAHVHRETKKGMGKWVEEAKYEAKKEIKRWKK